MSLSGIVLGLINVGIVVVLLLLVGAVAQYIMRALGWGPDDVIVKLYLALVALIALYMIVALIFGLTTIRIIG